MFRELIDRIKARPYETFIVYRHLIEKMSSEILKNKIKKKPRWKNQYLFLYHSESKMIYNKIYYYWVTIIISSILTFESVDQMYGILKPYLPLNIKFVKRQLVLIYYIFICLTFVFLVRPVEIVTIL